MTYSLKPEPVYGQFVNVDAFADAGDRYSPTVVYVLRSALFGITVAVFALLVNPSEEFSLLLFKLVIEVLHFNCIK